MMPVDTVTMILAVEQSYKSHTDAFRVGGWFALGVVMIVAAIVVAGRHRKVI